MRKKLTTILILILVLTQLCACGKPQTDSLSAAESEAAAQQPPDRQTDAGQDGSPAADERTPDRVLSSLFYTAKVYSETQIREQCRLEQREYAVSDGVHAFALRATGKSSYVRFLEQTISETGTVWYYRADTGAWASQPLGDGLFSSPVVVVTLASGQSWFLALPRTYRLHENDSKEYLPEQDGVLRIVQMKTGEYHMTMDGYGLTTDCVTDALILEAPFQLVNWDLTNCAAAWVNYVKDGASQWCFDGYYRRSPSNYIPTGTDYYYCCAASYCIKGFLACMPLSKEAAALCILTLDTMAQRQNSYGYWATEPGSEWLQGDYGIGAGFYDTRFNTDLLELFITASRKLGMGMFDETITRYAGFFIQLADMSHIETENGGWLIPDYWHPSEISAPHTSLNHQASECLALYHAADLLTRDDLRALAGQMLLAIEDTGAGWVMPNHNLYYSIKPDGTYVEGDYPYLTYNDLYYLQKYLTGTGTPENETITELMREKLRWMQNTGVTGYEKS